MIQLLEIAEMGPMIIQMHGLMSPERRIRELYRCVDARDWLGVSGQLHDSCVYYRPGYEPLLGKDSVMDFYRRRRVIASGDHVLENVLDGDGAVACWGRFEGLAKDGRRLSIGFAEVFQLREGLIGVRRTYLDKSDGI